MDFDNREFVFNQFQSLYIHCIFPNAADNNIIYKYFHENAIGYIENIDYLEHIDSNGQIYYSVFIHFTNWYNTQEA